MMTRRRKYITQVLSAGITWPAAMWLLMGWGEWEEKLSSDQGTTYQDIVCLRASGVVKADQSWCVVLTHLAVPH